MVGGKSGPGCSPRYSFNMETSILTIAKLESKHVPFHDPRPPLRRSQSLTGADSRLRALPGALSGIKGAKGAHSLRVTGKEPWLWTESRTSSKAGGAFEI